MGERWISRLWSQRLVEFAVAEGASREQMPTLSEDERITESEHIAVWNAVMRACRDAGLPIRFAESMWVDDYDLLGLVCKTAPDLRSALERLIRYIGQWTNSIEIRVVGGAIEIDRQGPRRVGLRAAQESTAAEIIKAVRDLCSGELNVEEVAFAHARPDDDSEHRRFFAAPIEWNSTADVIALAEGSLDTPLRLADPALSEFLIASIESRAGDPLREIRDEILGQLEAGTPNLATVAAAISQAPRTLQRMLSEHGTTFADLRDSVRLAAARALLAEGKTIEVIAARLGFAEVRSFQRAFRRWTGKAPSEARKP